MSRGSGFTPIEMLVVIAVIATLAAILFPVFAQVREQARRSTCLSNLRQLALAHSFYVEDSDGLLPNWWALDGATVRLWPEILRPYSRDPKILDQGFTTAAEKQRSGWLADYTMLAWGPGGTGSAGDPYWRWPGAFIAVGSTLRPMALAEVRRPGDALQFADGLTDRSNSYPHWAHGNEVLNGAFLDGHVARIPKAEWDRVNRDAQGYFYHVAAADR